MGQVLLTHKPVRSCLNLGWVPRKWKLISHHLNHSAIVWVCPWFRPAPSPWTSVHLLLELPPLLCLFPQAKLCQAETQLIFPMTSPTAPQTAVPTDCVQENLFLIRQLRNAIQWSSNALTITIERGTFSIVNQGTYTDTCTLYVKV